MESLLFSFLYINKLKFFLAVGASYAPDLSGYLRGAFGDLDDAPERLERDLSGLGGGDDETFSPEEQAGKDAKPQQVGLA